MHIVKIGTIDELTGQGEEWLVDAETRQFILAKFINGNLESTNAATDIDSSAVTKTAA